MTFCNPPPHTRSKLDFQTPPASSIQSHNVGCCCRQWRVVYKIKGSQCVVRVSIFSSLSLSLSLSSLSPFPDPIVAPKPHSAAKRENGTEMATTHSLSFSRTKCPQKADFLAFKRQQELRIYREAKLTENQCWGQMYEIKYWWSK